MSLFTAEKIYLVFLLSVVCLFIFIGFYTTIYFQSIFLLVYFVIYYLFLNSNQEYVIFHSDGEGSLYFIGSDFKYFHYIIIILFALGNISYVIFENFDYISAINFSRF